jgi:hypothetical protein
MKYLIALSLLALGACASFDTMSDCDKATIALGVAANHGVADLDVYEADVALLCAD